MLNYWNYLPSVNFDDFTLLFCRGQPRNVQSFKHTCWAIVLPVRSFVLSRLRCRRRRDLLKVPINRALLSIEPGSQWLRASKILGGSSFSRRCRYWNMLLIGTPSVQRVQLKYLLSDLPWKRPLNSYTTTITKIHLNTFSVSFISLVIGLWATRML